MGLLFKGGEVVTATSREAADVACEGEIITAVGPDLPVPPGAEVIDARGCLVFPGFIDPHVHLHLPGRVTTAKDDFASGTQAALVGGTTTVIEMCCPETGDDLRESYARWQAAAAGRAACDYSFHLGVARWDAHTEAQVREIVAGGVTSLKIFLAYQGVYGLDDAALYGVLRLARELNVIVAAHCENATLVTERARELLAAGRTEPAAHHDSRPPVVEAEGVHHLLTFAELTGAETYLAHTSCAEALEVALAARRRGVRARIEAVIQHLLLDKTWAERPDFEGAKYIMSPPLREARHQAVLWEALRAGHIDTVATDHAPFDFATQKARGRGDFTQIPNGIPAIEERVKLLHTYGVGAGRIELPTLVNAASTRAAKIFGLYPRKGTVAVGADADLVVFDPRRGGVISARTHRMNVDYSAFEGWRYEGSPVVVTVRGEVMVRDGRFAGSPGRGRFLARKVRPSELADSAA
ncbi:MAG: dihydropyrimidinase [Verrucomicrobia bacterium]|nr:dihydropyrimidinase [Verrucomicrobiota bacterium]